AGALLVNCTDRGTSLYEQPNVDVNLAQTALGDVPLAGFFAAGEIGPIGNRSFLHSHTATLAVFRPLPPTSPE
ncbi:MAG: FIST C-terminal domain-containing protein, partial [Phycisphaeraceae bacterium]|nr:FIST C-terminal domain-containing protein [Phycisphaeraceae bacterium]